MRLREELDAYFRGKLQQFSVPLVYPGSPFQVRVWNELLRIPYGETVRMKNSPGALVALGTACRGSCEWLNRIAIVIPCHRVVNKDGKLGGYGGGLWRKQTLLDLEKGV